MNNTKQKGAFTLIEVIIVVAISVLVFISIVSNFSRNRLLLSEVARLVVSDIRTAQANALASKQFRSAFGCGYGIHMLMPNELLSGETFGQIYIMHTTRNAPPNCGSLNYQPSDRSVVQVVSRILDPRLEICGPPSGPDNCGRPGSNFPKFLDIFFTTPSALTHIDGRNCVSGPPPEYSQIWIRKVGTTSCTSTTCIYICVYPSGRIETGPNPCSLGSNC